MEVAGCKEKDKVRVYVLICVGQRECYKEGKAEVLGGMEGWRKKKEGEMEEEKERERVHGKRRGREREREGGGGEGIKSLHAYLTHSCFIFFAVPNC